jgi:hypothetical protein
MQNVSSILVLRIFYTLYLGDNNISAIHSRWLLLLKIEISLIFYCCFVMSKWPHILAAATWHWVLQHILRHIMRKKSHQNLLLRNRRGNGLSTFFVVSTGIWFWYKLLYLNVNFCIYFFFNINQLDIKINLKLHFIMYQFTGNKYYINQICRKRL